MNKLKEFRLRHGLTQLEFACDIETQQTNVSKVELGKIPMPQVWLKKIKEVYNATPEELKELGDE